MPISCALIPRFALMTALERRREMVGKAVALALFVSFLGVFFPAAFLIATRGLSARKETIPFGPFLAAGAVIALLAT